jgi:rhamnose transport system permease protein
MIPQWKGDAYFRSSREGAEEAACELDVDLVWEGPNTPDATEQLMMLQAWNVRPVDAMAVAVSDSSGGSLALRKFRARKIPVVTWDSDAEPDSRDIFVGVPDARDLGYLTVYAAARLARHELTAEAEKMEAGQLGSLEVCDGVIMLGRESRTRQ